MAEKKVWKGLHNGEKRSKLADFQKSVGNPNKKVQRRLEGRLKAWEDDVKHMKTHGHQKPGSQQKART